MVYDAETCARNAVADQTNQVGYCLQQTREWCGIPAVYGDAATAWRNTNDRHAGNRNPPRGAPVYWTGGSHGYGHIALSLGDGTIRSTDAPDSGRVGTVDLDWPEKHWGLSYAGWAWDINETTIPHGGSSGGGSSSVLHGIDVSHYQSGLELGATDAEFAIFKATEGSTYTDPACSNFVAQARRLKMPWGLYHFWQGNPAEAGNFLARARQLDAVGEALLVLDFETHTADVVGARSWLDQVTRATGVRPLIYMSQSVTTAHDWSSVAKDYGLWVARYNTEIGPTGAWDTVAMWQYTDAYNTAGKSVDADRFYGDKQAWAAYARGEEEDMPLTAEEIAKIADAVWSHQNPVYDEEEGATKPARIVLGQTHKRAGEARDAAQD